MASISNTSPLTYSSLQSAHELIKPHVHRTPVLTNKTLSELASTPRTEGELRGTRWEGKKTPAKPRIRLWFKCENLQRIGAFKARGAFHAVKRLLMEEGFVDGGGMERGVVTHSSGNHAQALSLAAQELSLPAHIIMPSISVRNKIDATRGYGAKVIFSGSTSDEREAVAASVIEETGARLVPPYDHPDIILGQGTMGLELREQFKELVAAESKGSGKQGKCSFRAETTKSAGGQAPGRQVNDERELDAVITPCGGGGMLSGVALSFSPFSTRVFGAEPSYQGADDGRRGFEEGERIPKVSSLTIADGLRTPVGEWPWKIIFEQKMVEGMYAVTEDEIRAAMKFVLERFKMVVEPSACVGLAVCLFHEDFREMVEREGGEEGWDIGLVFSGGNVAVEMIGKLFAEDGKAE